MLKISCKIALSEFPVQYLCTFLRILFVLKPICKNAMSCDLQSLLLHLYGILWSYKRRLNNGSQMLFLVPLLRSLIFTSTSMAVSASRSALLPLAFLFLRDIRERIKTWRPWRRGAAPTGIDLTVAYHTEN